MTVWKNPKTDWRQGDGIKASDLNRIEGNTVWLSNMYPLCGTAFIQTPDNPIMTKEIILAAARIGVHDGYRVVLRDMFAFSTQGNVDYVKIDALLHGSLVKSINVENSSRDIELFSAPENHQGDIVFVATLMLARITELSGTYTLSARLVLEPSDA